MPKCEPGCTCKRHRAFAKPCQPGCTCGRHVISDERRRRISEALTGKPLSKTHRAAQKCAPGCDCWRHSIRNSGQFKPGSAGCPGPRSDETRAKLASYTGERASSYKHGLSRTPTYKSWAAMHSRCRYPSNGSWSQYGGRGITVCERWQDFLNFLADMGERPSKGHSIDRIDGNGNYEPGNCRWATKAEQSANRPDPGGWATRRRRMERRE